MDNGESMSVKPRNIRRIRYDQDNDDDVVDDLQDTNSNKLSGAENETRSPALTSLASMDENSTSTSNDTTPTIMWKSKQEKKNFMISPIVMLIGIMLGVATYLYLQMQSEYNNSTPETITEIVGVIDNNILSSRLRLPVMAALTMIMVTCFIGDTNLFQWERICLVGLFIWYFGCGIYNVCNYGFIVFMAWKFGTKNRYRQFSWYTLKTSLFDLDVWMGK